MAEKIPKRASRRGAIQHMNMQSFRTAVPGDLDGYLNSKIDSRKGSAGCVISTENKSAGSLGFGWGADSKRGMDDDDSVESEVTWMTFRDEMILNSLMAEQAKMNYIKTKQRGGTITTNERGSSSSRRHSLRSLLTRDHGICDLFDFQNAAGKTKQNELNQKEEGDDALETSPTSGELAVEFGLRPDPQVQNEEVGDFYTPDDHGEQKNSDVADAKVETSPTGKKVEREWYLDSIIELKLQLAQKQSAMDELAAKYNRVLMENDYLKHQLGQGETNLSLSEVLLKESSSESFAKELEPENESLALNKNNDIIKNKAGRSHQPFQHEMKKNESSCHTNSFATKTTASNSGTQTTSSARDLVTRRHSDVYDAKYATRQRCGRPEQDGSAQNNAMNILSFPNVLNFIRRKSSSQDSEISLSVAECADNGDNFAAK